MLFGIDLAKIYTENKDIFLIIITAIATMIATLVGEKIIPGLWKTTTEFAGKVQAKLRSQLSAKNFYLRYLDWLSKEFHYIDVRGIRTQSPVPIELEKLYVPLSVSTRYPLIPESQTDIEFFSEEVLSKKDSPIQNQIPNDQLKESGRLSLSYVLQEFPKKLVILGGPGTGKTTLLRYLVLIYCTNKVHQVFGITENRLPIFIHLRNLSGSGLTLKAENLPQLCIPPEIAEDCPAEFFKNYLKNGDCIILLDGLDEIKDEVERGKVSTQIEDFAVTYSNNRFIITSRSVGYSNIALTGFPQLEICNLNDKDVEIFARSWCIAMEMSFRKVNKEISVEEAERNAERKAKQLINSINENEGVHQLTTNPLMLTILALVHRYRATLPQRRVDLYEECIAVLLSYWDKAKGIIGELDWRRKRRLLEPLAYWMHLNGIREANRTQIERVIAQSLPNIGESESCVSELVEEIRDRSGLLNERGINLYGFSHLTFQEYLTASFLIDKGENGRKILMKKIHDSWWQEVILLYASMMDATKLIEEILDQPDDIYKNNLFLACKCLIDIVNINPNVSERLLENLLNEFKLGEFKGIRKKAYMTLTDLKHSPHISSVFDKLVDFLAYDDPRIRARSAFMLAGLGRSNEEIVDRVIELLWDRNLRVNGSAINALSEFGRNDQNVVKKLKSLLNVENEKVRAFISIALGNLGHFDFEFVKNMLYFIENEDEYEDEYNEEIIRDLNEFLETNPELWNEVVDLLNDQDVNVRLRTTILLSKLEKIEEQVVATIPDLLNDENIEVRGYTAYYLGKVGYAQVETIPNIVNLLNNEDEDICWRAAFALGEIGVTRPDVISGLESLRSHENKKIREHAIIALAELQIKESGNTQPIVDLLGDKDENVRHRASWKLTIYSDSDQDVIQILIGLLKDKDIDENKRLYAAISLQNCSLGRRERVIDHAEEFIGLLLDKNKYIREYASYIIGIFSIYTPEAVDSLVKLLEDEYDSVRKSAVYALGEIGRNQPEIAKILLTIENDRNKDVMINVINALGSIGNDDPEVLEYLEVQLDNKDEEIRRHAAYKLGKFGKAETKLLEILISSLEYGYLDSVHTLRDLRDQPQTMSALLAAVNNANATICTGAAWGLEVDFLEMPIVWADENFPTISPQHESELEILLDDNRIVNYLEYAEREKNITSNFGQHRVIKDIAWDLLAFYHGYTKRRTTMRSDIF